MLSTVLISLGTSQLVAANYKEYTEHNKYNSHGCIKCLIYVRCMSLAIELLDFLLLWHNKKS